jgi:hypothetical protein
MTPPDFKPNKSPGHPVASPSLAPAAMSSRELVELAGLDILGLLDEPERQSFEAGFAAAPEAIRAMVRQQQLLIATDESLLPIAQEPRPQMRDKVLQAIRKAMDAEAAQPAVIASIGASLGTLPQHAPIGRPGINPMWRTASIAGIAACVVLGLVTLKLQSDFRDVNRQVQSNQLADVFTREIGPQFEAMLLSPTARHMTFARKGESVASAALVFDAATGQGTLIARDLPGVDSREQYLVQIIGVDGEPATMLAVITPSSSRMVERLAGIKLEKGMSIALISQSTGRILLQTQPLS